ncbi:hypothetical protein ABID96_002018 [Bacillus sp. OAE603]
MLKGKRVLVYMVFYYFNTNQSNAITALEDINVKKLDVIKQLESPDQKT